MQTTFIPGKGVTLAVHDFGGNVDGDTVLIAHATRSPSFSSTDIV